MKQRFVYVWNGIKEVGGSESYYDIYSSRKKAIKHAIEKCERYGYIEPQIDKGRHISDDHISIVDYKNTFLGFVEKIPIL